MTDNLIIQNDKQLAEQINTEHKAVIDGLRASLDHAIKAGELLLDAKRIAGHGNWLEWLHTNCQFSERTAQNYIKLAENKERLSNTQRVAYLSLREAIALLTERTELEIHELCNIFPYDQSVVDAITHDMIKDGKYGYQMPEITLYEGKILDGKLRYKACKRAGIRPKFKTFPDDYPGYRGSALDFVMSVNIVRAQYTESQKAVMAMKLSKAG